MSDTYDASRTLLGKLPTEFVRPTSCNTPWLNSAIVQYAVQCSTTVSAEPHINYDTSCYPSPYADYGLAWPDIPFFSPASICPQGFTSACNVTKNVFDLAVPLTFGAGASAEVSYVLSDGETAVGCCPTGFACDSVWVQSCTSQLSAGDTVSGLTYGRSCSSEPTAISLTATTDQLGLATGITASQLNVWLLHNPEKDNGTSSSSGGGLSTGAKIGLGVGIPLGVIAVAAIIFICCYRKRKLEKEKQRRKDRQAEKPTEEPTLPPRMERPELQGSDGAAGLGKGGQGLRPKAELDTKTATATSTTVGSEELKSPELDSSQTGVGSRKELDSAQTGTESRHELESHASATITNIAELSSDPYRYELDAGHDARWKTREM